MSRTSPSGRFIYAFHKAKDGLSAMQRSNAALSDMISEGEITLGECEQERIFDYRGRLKGVAITTEF